MRNRKFALYTIVFVLATSFLAALPFPVGTVAAATSTFGNSTGSGFYWIPDYSQSLNAAGRFLCANKGQALNITAYLSQYLSYTPHMRFAIYSDSNGYPGTLVGYTAEMTFSGGTGWRTLNIESGGELQANTYYWLVIAADMRYMINYRTGNGMVEKSITYGEMPSTFPSGGNTYSTYLPAIYCTYQLAPVQLSVTKPANTTYTTPNIPVVIDAADVNATWFNVYNGSAWLYTQNVTYTAATYLNGLQNGTYTLYAWATTQAGATGAANTTFTVAASKNLVATAYSSRAVRWQEKTFYAAGRYWAFWADSDGSTHVAKYATSSDGVYWEPAESLTPATLSSNVTAPLLEWYGECVQAVYQEPYVHVFLRCLLSGTVLLYRCGVPQSNGSIAWLNSYWDTVWSRGTGQNVDFFGAVDSNGYPWVSWGYGEGISSIVTYVRKSAYNNGSWSTEQTWNVSGTYMTNNFLLSLGNGSMYVVYFKSGEPMRGRLFNGTGWMQEETVSVSSIVTQYSDGYESWSRGAVVDGADNIHLVFVKAESYDLIYVARSNTTGTWSTEQTVQTATAKTASPSICLVSDILTVFYVNTTDSGVYYKQKPVSGTWSQNATLLTTEQNGFSQNNDGGYDGLLNSFTKHMEGKLALLWCSGTSSPYKIKLTLFNLSSFPPELSALQSEGTVYPQQWFTVNATVYNFGGVENLAFVNVVLSSGATLTWHSAGDTFGLYGSTDYTLNQTECVKTVLSDVAARFTWQIKVSTAHSEGYVHANLAVYNQQLQHAAAYYPQVYYVQVASRGEPVLPPANTTTGSSGVHTPTVQVAAVNLGALKQGETRVFNVTVALDKRFALINSLTFQGAEAAWFTVATPLPVSTYASSLQAPHSGEYAAVNIPVNVTVPYNVTGSFKVPFSVQVVALDGTSALTGAYAEFTVSKPSVAEQYIPAVLLVSLLFAGVLGVYVVTKRRRY